MTSTPVSGQYGILTGTQMSPVTTSGKIGTADFKNMMGEAKENLNDNSKVIAKSEKMTNEARDVKEINRTESGKETVVERKELETRQVEKSDVDKVTEAVNEIKDLIEEELEVTDEDIEKALESLGLSVLALMDTGKFPEIVATLTNSEDVLSLAMDEELYSKLTTLTSEVEAIVSDLGKDLNVETEDFLSAIKAAASDIKADALLEANNPIDEMTSEGIVNANQMDADDEADKADKADKAVSFEEKITVLKFERKSEIPQAKESESTDEFSIFDSEGIHETMEKDFDKSKQSFNQNGANMSFAQNLLSKVAEALNQSEEVVSYSEIQTENIMNQITEAIDISISDLSSEINLKLHPESLGSLTVKVTSNNEGVLTAQFTAQNESVKAVIESQALVLRETLESKGVTVEAVEVMVQSHEFEADYNDRNQRNQQSNERRTRGIRKISLVENEDEVIPEDNLLKQMMIENGNTLDYSV